jgi:hypothetical protein
LKIDETEMCATTREKKFSEMFLGKKRVEILA